MATRLYPNKRLTDHPKWADIATRLEKIGLQKFSHPAVIDIHDRLLKSISIGLKRSGEPTTTDGGVMAAPTHVQHFTLKDMQQVPDHTRGITAACGGTNWIFAETEKEKSGNVYIGRSVVKTILERNRQHTLEGFVEIIADGVAQAAKECGLMEVAQLPVSISLGFPQINNVSDEGDIDARIPTADLPKFWKITDFNPKLPNSRQPSLASILKQKLRDKGVLGVGQVVFVNDTVAVALDVQHNGKDGADAPVGFVFGTGTNGAMYGGQKKGMVNLEIGHAQVMDADQILSMMQKKGWVPDQQSIMEYWMGGAYISARVMAGIALLKNFLSAPAGVIKQISASKNQALMSDLSKGRPSPLLGLSMTADDYMIAHACADRAMRQAAQMIGVHLATACEAAKQTKGVVFVPYEGSVLGKGYHMKKRALETVRELLPSVELKPYEASGMVGVAKLAMVRLFK